MKPWAVAGVVLLAAGCGGVRMEQAGLSGRDRVGIVNLLRPQASHYHAGADQLTSFNKRYASDAGTPAFVAGELLQKLRVRYDYALVAVEPPDDLRGIGRDVLKRLQAGLNDVVLSAVQRIAREHRLDHVLIIGEICGPLPPPRRGEKCGYGLYTERTATGSSRAFAYFDVAVLRVEPDGRVLRPLTGLTPAETMRELAADAFPRDVEQLSAEDWRNVEPVVRALAQRRVAESVAMVQ